MNSDRTPTGAPVQRLAAAKLATAAALRDLAFRGVTGVGPAELSIEVSNECDLQCAMCEPFSGLNPRRSAPVLGEAGDFADSARIFECLAPLLPGVLAVHFLDRGEPTLHPDFIGILRRLAEYEVLVDFSTHGQHLSPQLCDELVSLGIHRIVVTFTGATKEEYESIHLGGSFEKALAGLTALKASKERASSVYPIVEAQSLAFEHQLRSLSRTIRLLARHGVSMIHLAPLQTPALFMEIAGHGAVYRESVEGELLTKASEIAAEVGVTLEYAAFAEKGVVDEYGWEQRQGAQFVKAGHPFYAERKLIPFTSFPRLIKAPQVVEAPSAAAQRPAALPAPELGGALLASHLDVRSAEDRTAGWRCLEPFTHLFVAIDGRVQGCTHAHRGAPSLALLPESDNSAFWTSSRFQLVRRALLNRRFPMRACEHCLKFGLAPRRQQYARLLQEYGAWAEHRYGTNPLSSVLWPVGDEENAAIAERALESDTTLVYSSEELRQSESRGGVRAVDVRGTDPRLTLLIEEIQKRHALGESTVECVTGHLDGCVQGEIVGWLWSPILPTLRLPVEILADGQPIGTVLADRFRCDLHARGIGDGYYGFGFPVPAVASPGTLYQAILPGAPIILRCAPVTAC